MAVFGYIEYQLPFCDPFLCSVDEKGPADDVDVKEVRIWECAPLNCKRNMEIFAVVVALLSIFTMWFNVIVLAANMLKRTRRLLERNPTMQNYSNYVISLALADLVMGAFVMPLAAVFFFKEAFTSRVALRLNVTAATRFEANVSDVIVNHSDAYKRVNDTHDIYATANATEIFHAGHAVHGSNTVLHLLGFFTHASIFVSVYTLAASSADRFYVSTKPIKNNGIRLSRSSLRRLSIAPSCGGPTFLAFDVSRSTIIVLIIWGLGVIFALLPFWLPGCYYHHVGHVFAAVSFKNDHRLTFSWYTIILSLPLAVTWIFSFLLSLLLRRRKQKLKRPSKSRKDGRKQTDRDVESSYAIVSRCSNTDTPVVRNLTRSSSSDNLTSTNHAESIHEVFVNDEQISDAPMRPKAHLAPSSSVPCTRRRRPSSLDSSLIACKLSEATNRTNASSDNVSHSTRERLLWKHYSNEEGFPAGYVAKRILFRRSWEGTSIPEDHFQRSGNSSISSSFVKSFEHRTSKTSMTSPPTSPSQSYAHKSEATRSTRAISSRARRRSSIYRAKEFLMSKSFESNIARTLVAVIAVFTLAVLPLLIVLSQIKPWVQSSLSQRNRDATALVVAVTILLSNSLWNCLIYGTRMPYFRSAVAQIVRKLFRCKQSVSCSRVLRRKLSLTSSFRRDSEISKPTWL